MLEGVGPRERKILSLMHVEGYTAKQVGAQMNMNESAVKVAAHRAIKKIREQFGHG
jgi:RNA polymerase sigma-70 factor (ECF subfamily)